MEWHHMTSSRKKKFKAIPSASKIMATVFWDYEGVILIDMLSRGQAINWDVYVEALKKLNTRFWRVLPHKDVTKVLLHHDNARPRTSLHTREAITKLQWTVLPHPPYSPDLAPSDYHLFCPLNDAVRGKKFDDDDDDDDE
jgi:histone-lysine N-methyltransferase SETMAR